MTWREIVALYRLSVPTEPERNLPARKTVATKPMFRDAFRRSRCLIPASGYYEWLPTPAGKQPYYYTARDGSPLTFAGLWDEWKDIDSGEQLSSCTMIVTDANALAAKVHTACRCYCNRRTLTPG